MSIVFGDCREVLKTLPRARLILTDPPYNIGFSGYGCHDDNMEPSEYIAMIATLKQYADIVAVIQYPEETMRFVVPALGVPDEVLAWCYNSNISRQFRLVSIYGGLPDRSRVLQPYKNPNDKRVKKLIDSGSRGTPIYDWFSDIQLVKNVSIEKSCHPCPIPERLAERMISMLTTEGDIVLDPFAGGGTVPCVAQRMGRIGVGIEKDPIYFQSAVERFASKEDWEIWDAESRADAEREGPP